MHNLPSDLPDSNGSPAPSTRLVLDRLIVQHQQWLKQIILARVGEPQATDEVFQEVAAQALLQKSPLLDESKTSAWLYRVAVRQCLLYRRKCGRQRRLLRRYGEEQTAQQWEAPDALHWLLKVERHDLVRSSVLELPAQDAELLLLKYTEGWRYQHMAQKLGLSVTIIEARLHRARARLRQLLQEKEDHHEA